jgi:hypothetical protein
MATSRGDLPMKSAGIAIAFAVTIASFQTPDRGSEDPRLHQTTEVRLPHNIPNLCAAVADRTVIDAGDTRPLTGDHSCVEVRGTALVTETLRVTTLLCYPGGAIEFSEGSQTIWRDTPLDLDVDPEQWGHGLVAIDCRVRARGQTKTPAARLASDAPAGTRVLSLAEGVEGWREGDRVAIPDTRHLRTNQIGANYSPQWEERSIAAISGRSITLSAPLTFGHFGARNAAGTLEFLPHLLNLTRSILVRSENPRGTRGHMAFIGRADVDLRGIEVRDMGRTSSDPLHCTLRSGGMQNEAFCDPGSGAVQRVGTNQIGRYPVHFHDLDGPAQLPAEAPQFVFAGSSVTGSRKWPIAIHNSHYGLVKDNVVWGYEGAGLMTEDGSETGNVIEHNFVFKGERSQGGRSGGGREGVAFYFRGPNNSVRRNVAGNVMPHPSGADSAYGYKYFLATGDQGPGLGAIPIPTGKGESGRRRVGAHTLPIPEFADNECYGAMESCLTYWWIGTAGAGATVAAGVSTFKNLRVWHVHNKGIFHYEGAKIVHDGLTVRGSNPGPSAACCGVAFDGADYKSDDVTIRNADIQNINTGIIPSANGSIVIENSRVRTLTDIYLQTLWTSSAWADDITRPRFVVLRNVSLDGTTKVRLDYSVNPVRHLVMRDEILVEAGGTARRIFYTQQAPDFVVPASQLRGDGRPLLIGAPVPGLTNQEAWAGHGVAIAGAVATCTVKLPGFQNALVCDAAAGPAHRAR